MSPQTTFPRGQQVRSSRWGLGIVEADTGETVLVRFDRGIESCPRDSLVPVASAADVAASSRWDAPLRVIARAQAEAIRSINDVWGVFTPSRIQLLPHQLWVCRQVLQTWPTRWLVADDVGLGKTIEAGLVLMPLLSRNQVRRLLILCPASLVGQWNLRMRRMFDIRLTEYRSESDTASSGFWETHDQVVASLQTLRSDNSERLARVLEAEPWDLLIVDEAHHLNADDQDGPTLGYKFVKQLIDQGKVNSRLFFTGTPHRGKNYGFLALMQLLDADRFDPQDSLDEQLPHLSSYVIRNNKENVTDLTGKRLFHKPSVRTETYAYSPAEADFYDMLTEFISTGRTYATGLDMTRSRTAMLVLIAMQKLASSSVAAIRSALQKRLDRIRSGENAAAVSPDTVRRYEQAEESTDFDDLNSFEEELPAQAQRLRLAVDEELWLRQLIAAADAVTEETKITSIMRLLETQFADRPVLFFTEYKATQALLLSALMRRYGPTSVAFINGDERLDDVLMPDGSKRPLTEPRTVAADRFNSGKARFLVSTEAGGEGIDLQERCHSLVHVDLPWNPMRMHQRVGRLNRYGQRHRVEVVSFHNPDTVESRIWQRLNEKIERIMLAFGSVMEEPEDLMQLVLGMTSPSLFRDLYAEAPHVRPESLSRWFDERTAQFGGRDVIETVKALVGNCAKFDFQRVSADLPPVDLPALKPFVTGMLVVNNRRPTEDASGALSFRTPDGWNDPALRTNYSGMVFDRLHRPASGSAADGAKQILGVGHKVVDVALAQALAFENVLSSVPATALASPLVVFRVTDRVTDRSSGVQAVVVGVGDKADEALLRDWEVLAALNGASERLGRRRWAQDSEPAVGADVDARVATAQRILRARLPELQLPFQLPDAAVIAVLWPDAARDSDVDEGDKPESTD